jgi:hypothetical protein
VAVFDRQGAEAAAASATRPKRAREPTHWVQRLQRDAGNRAVASALSVQRDQPLVPAYAQKGETCEPASIVTALITWDREANNSADPNGNVNSVCDAALLHLAANKATLVARLGAGGKDGTAEFNSAVATVQGVQADARAGTSTSETNYQNLATVLSRLFDSVDSTMRALGVRTTMAGYDTLGEIFRSPELSGLTPGQIAQVEWYVNAKAATQNGQQVPAAGYHAFLVGRKTTANGTWFLSDQGNQPPLVLEAADLAGLKGALDAAAASGRSWLDTRPTTRRLQLTSTGVRILDKPEDVEARHRKLLPPGQSLGDLKGKLFIPMVTWDWVGTATSLSGARALFGSTGLGHGFVIAELPAGTFNVVKTNPVPDSMFKSTMSPAGLLVSTPPGVLHSWLQLANAGSSRPDLLPVS